MSEVHAADHAARLEEKRQQEKTDAEQRQSKAAFEKRLQEGKNLQKQQQVKQGAQKQAQSAHAEKQQATTQQQKGAQQAKGQQQAAKAGQQAAKQAGEQQQSALAHLRGQAAQQNARASERARAGLAGLNGRSLKDDAEKVASESQEGAKSLTKKGDESVSTGKATEKRSAKEADGKERVREKEKEEVKNEAAQEAKAQQQAQDVRGAQQSQQAQQAQVDADGRRQQGQGGGGQQGQQQNQRAIAEQQATQGPSQSSIRRAAKAEEIQKLCEKLLDNFYMGAAPDGSAMMRMELKEGVLAGLVIDLKVDDKRRVKLTLSGGNKEAIDFVTSSRGELSRALGKKGLVLESVDAA